ncbi:hypothetical protein BDW22DRAFT_1304042, partial [Trametopsis cervina]
YMASVFNIDRALAEFFDNVRGFRHLQKQCGVLISGSFALQFLGRFRYEGSDLDLFLPMHSRIRLAMWLETQGYVFCPRETQPADIRSALCDERGGDGVNNYVYPYAGIFAVVTFRKERSAEGLPSVVQLIVAWRTPMEVILGFHSTCVLNVITFDTAYSLYPQATYEDMCNLVLLDTPSRAAALEKYSRRGWSLIRRLELPQFDLDCPFRSL